MLNKSKFDQDYYIYINPKFAIYKNIDGIYLVDPKDHTYEIDDFGTYVFRFCNGNFSYNEIIEQIKTNVELDIGSITKELNNFLNFCFSQEILLKSSYSALQNYTVKGSSDIIIPSHLSIEITDFCNLNCIFCYKGEAKNNFIDLTAFKSLIDEASKIGVYNIEITGGEPLSHPNFKEVLEATLTKFNFVTILSNGTLIGNHLKLFQNFRNQIKFQISLSGSTPALHDSISLVKGSFANLTEAIKQLVSYKIEVDIVMNIFHENLEDMENTLLLSHSLGASKFSCSPVVELGRAKNISILNEYQYSLFFNNIDHLQKKYADFYLSSSEGIPIYSGDLPHCGAGIKSLTITPDMRVKLCPFASEDEHILGTVKPNNFYNFLENNFSTLQKFKNISVPNALTCSECNFNNFCIGCFVRPLFKLKDEPELQLSCKWNKINNLYRVN